MSPNSALNDINKASFYLPFSQITRGGATKFSKRKRIVTAQPFDAWRPKTAGIRARNGAASGYQHQHKNPKWRLPLKFVELSFLRMQHCIFQDEHRNLR